jgi:uncharacterized peroxidase-related enzyme
LVNDFKQAELNKSDMAMLRYAETLTQEPWRVKKRDVDRLKVNGFDDSAILSINLVISYFNFVNRLANGLGVKLEDYWQEKEVYKI